MSAGHVPSFAEHGEVRATGIEPDIEDVGFFAPLRRAAASTLRSRRKQLFGRMREPCVRAFALEKRKHVAQRFEILKLLATAVAIENDERNAPESWREYTNRALRDHLGACALRPCGLPLHFVSFPRARSGEDRRDPDR